KLVGPGEPPREPVPWLYRVVRNGALDAGKSARRRQRRQSAVARAARWFVEPDADGLDAETAVAGLQRLPPEQREAAGAPLWGGLSFEQIPHACGCSASTVFRRYRAAIDALRELLGEPCPDRSKNV